MKISKVSNYHCISHVQTDTKKLLRFEFEKLNLMPVIMIRSKHRKDEPNVDKSAIAKNVDIDIDIYSGHRPEGDGLTEIKRKGVRSFPFAVLKREKQMPRKTGITMRELPKSKCISSNKKLLTNKNFHTSETKNCRTNCIV